MSRLDVYLTENGFFDSRSKAKQQIESGRVSVNGKTEKRASFIINQPCDIKISGTDISFVSRGGFKLLSALNSFEFDVSGLVCADIGASTGGFTDCLLQNGAKKVYAIDCGTNQLHPSLKSNSKVIGIENLNARNIQENTIPEKCDLAVMDVSFISQTLLFDPIRKILKEDGTLITLIKPQFEVGKRFVKKGVLKDKKLQKEAIVRVYESALSNKFNMIKISKCPILGGDGNQEYTAMFNIKSENPIDLSKNLLSQIIQ